MYDHFTYFILTSRSSRQNLVHYAMYAISVLVNN